MIKRTFTLTLFCLLLTQLVTAQVHNCGQYHATNKLNTQIPGYENLVNQTFENAKQVAQQQATSRSREVLTVPVVVHVVYNTDVQNVSDELIHSQIQVLNEDFQRLNPDAGDARPMFQSIAGNAEIQFVLADTDPAGNPTTGITRTQTDVVSFTDVSFDDFLVALDSCGALDPNSPEATECLINALFSEEEGSGAGGIQLDDVKNSAKGGQDPWDTKRYINIWVTNLNINLGFQEIPAIMGFAYPPTEAPHWPTEELPQDLTDIDGIVMHHQAFGVNNPNAGPVKDLFKKGRTCTHEMGHYFGLRHISGDGDCASDDGIADTPSEVASQQLDPENIPTCEELHDLDTCPEDDMPDMYENFMSYNPEACQNLFTQEQVGIMRAMLEGPRAGLIMQQTTSTVSEELAQAVTLYPNPTNGALNIQVDGYELADFTIEVQNLMGQKVLSLPAQSSIDISNLTAGIYLVGLKNQTIQAVEKITIVK